MKPILFNTEMVRAILENRKGATRRLAYIPLDIPCSYGEHEFVWDNFSGGEATGFVCRKCGFGVSPPHSRYPVGTSCFRPRYFPGDVLYVRETWARIPETWPGDLHFKSSATKADLEWFREMGWKWRPSIHMPKEIAQLFLRVTNVQMERLQEITEEQAILEGIEKRAVPVINASNVFEYRIPGTHNVCISGRGAFSHLWDRTIKKANLPRYGWNANPWVWVTKFERISKGKAMKGGDGNG